jgi:predicted DNA-binding protein
MAMIRKQVYISPEQQKTLKTLARETGKTEAEIIRNALGEHARLLKDKKDRMSAWRAIEAGIDRRAKRHKVTTVRPWKRDDLYDRNEAAG